MNTTTDFMGYTVIATGVDAGRYATPEVAMESYADELYGYISDVSKDAQGFRHRMDISGMTFAQLEAECDYWSDRAKIAIEREKQYAQKCVADFVELLEKTISYGANDEETALRWLIQGEKFYCGQDVEHWVYNQGILFTDYGKELCKKLEGIVSYEEVA